MAKQQWRMFQLVVAAFVAIGAAQAFVVPLSVPPPSSLLHHSYSVLQGGCFATTNTDHQPLHYLLLRMQPPSTFRQSLDLFMSSTKQETDEDTTMGSSSPALTEEATAAEDEQMEFTAEEVKIIEALCAQGDEGGESESSSSPDRFQKIITDALPSLPPKLVLKLRQAQHNKKNSSIRRVATELNHLLELRMTNAKETLKSLLQAGEIRKLDNLIGQAARNGDLDVAFFNVLSYNLKDAALVEQGSTSSSSSSQEVQKETKENAAAAASRLQILQHIYTRCQEEVEKSIPPGSTLLNKLLRTREDAIRANLYRHYLTIPETNTIVTPDGKKVEIKSQTTAPKRALVSIDEFCTAIAQTVQQIRTMEQAHAGMDQVSAANMVETCRQIAKEARGILGAAYGVESKELKSFEASLQPIFRPTSAESPYIKGTD
jgi:hypothetical protein